MSTCALALILLLDSSGSLRPDDWRRQIEGHARAFESEAIAGAVAREGPIAVRADHFAYGAEPLLGWTVLRTVADARGFGAALRDAGRAVSPDGGTMTGHALGMARRAMDSAPCDPERRVVDLVTDGVGHDTGTVAQERGRYGEADIRLNALFVETPRGREDTERAGFDDGLAWLREEVVTPDGAALAAEGWADFERAIRRKITWEISAR